MNEYGCDGLFADCNKNRRWYLAYQRVVLCVNERRTKTSQKHDTKQNELVSHIKI